MPIDPIKTTEAVKENFKKYLSTSFRLQDQKLRALFNAEMEKFPFTNGPILEATPPFKRGRFLKDLSGGGKLDEECKRFLCRIFPDLENKPLYLHQEKAVNKLLEGRNVVIASGTSSGKTEAFLIPIYSYLFKEYKEGNLTPGVRALLLYPMNALANDQLRRLRKIARIMEKEMPDVRITFGRYVGDTPQGEKQGKEKFKHNNPGEEIVKSEMLSRDEMQKTPPHILITNYAMLEYLLLRPKDSPFFDGIYANDWKFLVLDEAHTYSGANGMEIGMLIRRLKDRVCRGGKNALQCIATSATLVREEEDFGKVAEFASNLFGERFEWDPADENKQDVIKGERIEIPRAEGMVTFPIGLYKRLDEITRGLSDPSDLLERCFEECKNSGVEENLLVEARQKCGGSAKQFLYEVLSKDSRVGLLKRILEKGPKSLDECAREFMKEGPQSNEIYQSLISLVNVAVWARPDKESLPLLPARYHLFVRAPEGIFMSFFPEPRVFLERREETEEGYPVFCVASCRRCGQEYLVGDVIDGKLKHSFEYVDTQRKNRYFILWKEQAELGEDEDEETAVPEEMAEKGERWKLCVKCGALWDTAKSCSCTREANSTRDLIEIIPRDGSLNKCYHCGLKSINVVREFTFQQDAPAAVLATALFQNLEKKEVRDRKILAFSDSRQDAAFFAPYLDFTYKHILYRRLIVEALKQNKSLKDYRLESLWKDVFNIAEEKGIFDEGLDEKQKKKEVWGWVLQEFCALDRRNSLEGVGLLSFSAISPKNWRPIGELSQPPWNMSKDEAEALYQVLLDTLRFNKAITFPPDGPSPQDEIFARFHRNKEFRFRGEVSNSGKGIYSFIPSGGKKNTRVEFVKKLHSKITGEELGSQECKELLLKIYNDLKTNWDGKGIHKFSDPKDGVLLQLDYKFWKVIQEDPDGHWFICDRCGTVSRNSIRGVCPTFECNGELKPLSSSPRRSEIENNHYRNLYLNLTPINLVAEEHTAQLKSDEASNVQQRFINGEINVLSCSTTFELGVDLGELETIFLRNVPPEPSNYIQRSGRAGRRLDSVGFTLTFAQLRSHDLTYFKEPEKMVRGWIKPPVVEIRNEKIIRRHMHSIVLAQFFRENPEFYGNGNGKVGSFFKLEDENNSGLEMVREYLESKPIGILDSLRRTIPRGMHSIFDIENWGWINEFTGEGGVLETADLKIREEYRNLKEFYEKKEQEWIKTKEQKKRDKLNADMRWAYDRMETIRNRDLLDFLATNNVIPKYGFPVDVVELTLYSHVPEAKKIQLERDLRIAISEFAPTSQVVAKKYIWESAGLKVVKERAWPKYWYAVCPKCRRYIQSNLIGENPPPFILCEGCGEPIPRNDIHKFITPIFGFVTGRESKPQRPGESRPKREFTTRPYFFNYKEPEEKEFQIGKFKLRCRYSPKGELAVICRGRKGVGFWVCFNCGAGFSARPPKGKHRKPTGEECSSSAVGPLHFGHTFGTDVLAVRIEQSESGEASSGEDFWLSLLYALLEGASQALGIRRQDLDGCLYPYERKIWIVFFDNVPGGAGYVKHLIDKNNLQEVFNASLYRLEKCTCGPETSCYGCLRNYQNQFCHEQLKRGIILKFLKDNLTN